MSKASWPAPERNKAFILEVLRRVLPRSGTVLEIASGSGQHAEHFARNLPGLDFLPSDIDAENLASIRAWVEESNLPNLRRPIELDVYSSSWNVPDVAAVFNANMIHITPWSCAVALFQGIERHLRNAGTIVMYGPFRVEGSHTSPSNEAFDASLRARDSRWGVRDLEAVQELAKSAGFELAERVSMPANNQTLVFARS